MINRPTAGLEWPLPTISKACNSGTPDFIMVANWRVNSVTSFSVTDPPLPARCFLTESILIPWRRNVALTCDSLAARISPRTDLPPLSFPVHTKVDSWFPGLFFAAAAVAIGPPYLLNLTNGLA